MTLQTRIHASRRSPTALVAGGAGFIGSHLCDALLQRGNTVICVDNLFTGTTDNIRPLLNHPNFRFIEHDVRDPIEIEGDIDRIYSLACPASPRHYQTDPVGTMKTCVLGSINLLELARQKGARILQASTSEVYGDPEVHPQPESYLGNVNPIGPRACYDEGKRAAETLMFDYHRQHGTEIKVARIFNTYGPRMLENDGRVVSNFIVQALRGEPITIYGQGTQTRSFCFVDDLVRAGGSEGRPSSDHCLLCAAYRGGVARTCASHSPTQDPSCCTRPPDHVPTIVTVGAPTQPARRRRMLRRPPAHAQRAARRRAHARCHS